MENIKYKNYNINIDFDDYPENPREWDNLGTMVCFHKRYYLGDKHNIKHEDFSNWHEMKEYIEKTFNTAVILPLYLYDHSGITMNTTGFSCPWDSGMVGFIYISKEKVKKEYGIKKITKQWIEKITQYLKNEVDTYDKYLTGQIYQFVVKDENDNLIHSCSGFYDEKEAIKEAENIIDHELKNIGEQITMQLA